MPMHQIIENKSQNFNRLVHIDRSHTSHLERSSSFDRNLDMNRIASSQSKFNSHVLSVSNYASNMIRSTEREKEDLT
jgi:proteasome lid subunit RPN8/RPN11